LSTTLRVVPGSTTNVTAVLQLTNQTPLGQPPYIAGTGSAGVPPDTYLALATVTMPSPAADVLVDGKPLANDSGVDGPTRVVAVARSVAPGSTTRFTISFTLPWPHGRLQVESATVAVDTSATATASGADDRRPVLSW